MTFAQYNYKTTEKNTNKKVLYRQLQIGSNDFPEWHCISNNNAEKRAIVKRQ